MLTSPLRTSVLHSKHPLVLKATALGSLAKQLIGASRAPTEVLAGSWVFRAGENDFARKWSDNSRVFRLDVRHEGRDVAL